MLGGLCVEVLKFILKILNERFDMLTLFGGKHLGGVTNGDNSRHDCVKWGGTEKSILSEYYVKRGNRGRD